MLPGYDDGSDEAIWSGNVGPEDDVESGSLELAPRPPAPKAKAKKGSDEVVSRGGGGGGGGATVDLDKLLKGPIDEVYRTNSPGDAEFLVAHMKQSLAGLRPTIESFESFNAKLEEENRRLAEEEADLDERLRALGIVVEPGPGQLASLGGGDDDGNGNGGGDGDELGGYEEELAELEAEIEFAQMELDEILEMVRRDVSIVKKIEARAPPEVQEFLRSAAFWNDVQDRYTRLDVDKSGTIDANELYPIIVELTDSEPWAVTEEHCKKVSGEWEERARPQHRETVRTRRRATV